MPPDLNQCVVVLPEQNLILDSNTDSHLCTVGLFGKQFWLNKQNRCFLDFVNFFMNLKRYK